LFFVELVVSKTIVAFHAELSSDRTYNGGSVWVYDKVVTNVLNAYSPETGKFTTPRKGVYQFNWYTLSGPGKSSYAGLYVNGELKGRQSAHNDINGNMWITADSSIVLMLEKGDSVYIMDVNGIEASMTRSWTSFGGMEMS
jgi:hypothetical protein